MADVDAVAAQVARRFIERRDVKAVQRPNGIYTPDRTKFQMADLRAHLTGERTLGHYMVSRDDTCRLFAFDIDLVKEGSWTDDDGVIHEFSPRGAWHQEDHPAMTDIKVQLRCMAEAIALRARKLFDVPVAISYSGSKGLHVYVWTGSISAQDARDSAWFTLQSFGDEFRQSKGIHFWEHSTDYAWLEVETFPKQTTLVDKDLGNLMRLPLGVHQGSGHEAFFIRTDLGYDRIEPIDPADLLDVFEHGNVR